MGKYSDRLGLKNSTEQPVKASGKWSSRLGLGGGSAEPVKQYIETPGLQDTGSISTITGKPEQEYTATSYQPADFKTLMQAGYVDDNDARINLFSGARGISPDRYEVKDGRIWFQGDDGNMYPETPKEAGALLKKLIAEIPSEGLADAGAALGAVSPVPFGAAAGAAAGEWVRKTVGKELYGDKQKTSDYAKDMGLQALFGGLDAGLGKTFSKFINKKKISKATGGKLVDDLTKIVGDIPDADRVAGKAIHAKGKSMGVDLKPHQAMDDASLTGYYKLLRDNPKTARQVRTADNLLEKQTLDAGDNLVKEISPTETDAFEIGQKLSEAGTAAIDKMKQVRGNAVKDLYDKSRIVDNVDVLPVIEEIGKLKATVKPGMKAHNALTRVERMLHKEVDGDMVPETNLEVIDNIKQEIDGFLTGKNATSITNKLKRKMQQVKDHLTTQTDMVSRDYQVARALYSAASPKISKVEAGVVGNLSRMSADEMKEKAISKIFSSRHSVRTAKKHLEKVDPELWRDAVAEYMRQGFEKSAKVAQGSGGKVLNRPGKYVSKMWDYPQQRRLAIATEGMSAGDGTPLYNKISDFFEVMEKASIGQGKESATQTRQKMEKSMQGLAGDLSASVVFFRQTVANFFLKNQQERAFDKNAKKLLSLMQTPEGVDLIAKAKGYGPNTQKGLEAATTLLLMATETNAGKVKGVIDAVETEDESLKNRAPRNKTAIQQ